MVEESRGTAVAPIAVSTALHGGGLGPDTGGTLGAVSEERKDERCLLIVCGLCTMFMLPSFKKYGKWWKRAGAGSLGAYRASSGLVQGGLEGT